MEVFLGCLDELQCNILETRRVPIVGTDVLKNDH